MMNLKSFFALSLIAALLFTVSDAEAHRQKKSTRRSPPRCQGQLMDCRNNGDALRCMTCAAFLEARSENMSGMLRVVGVIKTRMAAPEFPRSACGVYFQKEQFDGAKIPYACVKTTERDSWRNAEKAARTGQKNDLKYFFTGRQPKWARYCDNKHRPWVAEERRSDAHTFMRDCFPTRTLLARYQRQTRQRVDYASTERTTAAR